MKKFAILAIVALLIAGTAWAQVTPPPGLVTPPTASNPGGAGGFTTSGTLSTQLDNANEGDVLDRVFDRFYAVQGSSVENHYSKGIFSSMVDNYINVREYDPETGTFFYLGGFHGNNNTLNQNYLSFGLAQTFDFGYMAFYYGGNLGTNRGWTNFAPKDPTQTTQTNNQFVDETVTYTETYWNNRLAVLFGTADLGAFRLDLTFANPESNNTPNQKATREGISRREYEGKRTQQGGSIGITWGGMEIAGLNPYATIGFKLPEGYEINHSRADAGTSSVTDTWERKGNTHFGLQVGASHESGLWGDLGIHNASGTETTSSVYPNPVLTTSVTTDQAHQTNGILGLALRAGYYKAFDAGPVSFGFNPIIGLGMRSHDRSITFSRTTSGVTQITNFDESRAKQTNMQIKTDLNLGLKYQVSEKFCLYTGAELRLFDYRSVSRSGGDDNRVTTNAPNTHYYAAREEDKAWRFNGIQWQTSSVEFGLTFTPIENLVIGAGLESFMDQIFKANIDTMQLDAGDWFTDLNYNDQSNILAQAMSLFQPVKLKLTVSYRIPSGGNAAAAE